MELYQPPFAAAVAAGVGAVMCGYNRINGVYACQSNWTINTMLRDYTGFKGFVCAMPAHTHARASERKQHRVVCQAPRFTWLFSSHIAAHPPVL